MAPGSYHPHASPPRTTLPTTTTYCSKCFNYHYKDSDNDHNDPNDLYNKRHSAPLQQRQPNQHNHHHCHYNYNNTHQQQCPPSS